MDTCHRKNAELETKKCKQHKKRVVLRGDIVKDDSGAYAVFTEQGSATSQMRAAKSNGPDCDGQAADAISAHSGKVEGCSEIVQSSDVKVSRNMDESWAVIGDPVVLLERNVYGHPLAGLLWERQFEKSSARSLDGKKSRIGTVCLFIENKDYFSQYMWMTLKWLERSRVWLPCGRN